MLDIPPAIIETVTESAQCCLIDWIGSIPFFSSRRQGEKATVETLDIPGVTVERVELNGVVMVTPVGHVLPQGQPGDIDNYTPSEAVGYSMRNALLYDDKEFFQKLLNGYLFLTNQSTIYRESEQHLPENLLAFGLIGWSPDISNIPETLPYQGLTTNFVSAASDADEDIINAMIEAQKKWGEMTAIDPLLPTEPSTYATLSLVDFIDKSIESYVNFDIGSVNLWNKNYDPVMTLDNWGHDPMFPGYFDPLAFHNMITFVYENSLEEGQASRLIDSAQNSLAYISNIQTENGGWVPDTPWNLSGAYSFGYDAVRFLMRYGEYILYCDQEGGDPLNMLKEVEASLSTLVSLIFSNNGSYLSWQNGTVTFTPTGLGYGQFTGPLLVALTALSRVDLLPEGVTESTIEDVAKCLEHDLTEYSVSSSNEWQKSYFAIELALISQGIIEHFSRLL